MKEKERKAKLKKKAELEKHWDMLRWITSFIEENKIKWNEQDLIKEQEREAWEIQTNEEKINILKEQENKKLSREEKIALADTKKKYWTEWRGLKHPEQPGRIPKQRSDEVSQVTPNKSSRGERGGGDPEKRAKPPLTPQPTSIVGDMKIGSAEINYAHCAERLRRKFQISVYRAYENSERLGTVKEENLPPLPPKKRAYKKVTVRNSNHEISPCPEACERGGGGDPTQDEAPPYSIKSPGDQKSPPKGPDNVTVLENEATEIQIEDTF